MRLRNLVFATLTVMAIAGCESTNRQDSLAEKIALDMNAYNTSQPFRYQITQTEFQKGEFGPVWVTQIDDPLPALAATPSASVEEVMLRGPLELVKAGLVIRSEEELNSIRNYIISFRDEKQTVYEISGPVMYGYVKAALDVDSVVKVMKITASG